jgi:cyclic beta-1,2-glucan synthetase
MSRRMEREASASRWAERALHLRQRAEEAGWDGAWYRRAYDDEGHPLGSATNQECRIDSISQSWACFASATPDRVRQALDSAWRELVSVEGGVARLLWPPFDQSPHDPGYIKGYPPGIRENGGQYSHAAAWLGMAFARTGQADKAFSIFNLLSPIPRTEQRAGTDRYRVEPYAVAADIAGAEPHLGRGGWTWYTGSAAWAWRLGVEDILGLRLVEGHLTIAPCIPTSWGGYSAILRGPDGTVSLEVDDPDRLGSGAVELSIDGVVQATDRVPFPAGGAEIKVVARLSAENRDVHSNLRSEHKIVSSPQ